MEGAISVEEHRLKFLPLIWSGIWRKPGRSILIFLQVSVAFALFGVLQGMKTGVEQLIEPGTCRSAAGTRQLESHRSSSTRSARADQVGSGRQGRRAGGFVRGDVSKAHAAGGHRRDTTRRGVAFSVHLHDRPRTRRSVREHTNRHVGQEAPARQIRLENRRPDSADDRRWRRPMAQRIGHSISWARTPTATLPAAAMSS